MNLPQLLAHPVVPHGDQALLASTDDLPVIHLDRGNSKLVGGDGQGDAVSAEVVDPHPAGPKVSTEISIRAQRDRFLFICAQQPYEDEEYETPLVTNVQIRTVNVHLRGVLSQEATGH